MERAHKEQIVAALHQIFADSALVVVTQQHGLTVAEANQLRRQMAEAGATFRVTKNRLAKIALEQTPYAQLAELFAGPTAVAYSQDPVAAAKVAVEYAKKNRKLEIVGGAMRDEALDADAVKALASLPSLDELRGQLVGLLQAPAAKLAAVLQTPGGQVARALHAYATREEAA